jgi:hypothetical protein
MDILAHTLWAGVGVALLRRRKPITPRTAVATMALAALPDVFQMLPVLLWGLLGAGSLEAIKAFAVAIPGQEPLLPPLVFLVSHTLHCSAHSALVAGLVTLVAWHFKPVLLVPLLGWWSHIVIDVFTHSADYYASPVLYPLTERGFDGIAWITPWFMVANYLVLGVTGLLLFRSRNSRSKRSAQETD